MILALDGLQPGLLGCGNNVDMVYDMCKEQRNICSLVYHTTYLKHMLIRAVFEPCSKGYHPKPFKRQITS